MENQHRRVKGYRELNLAEIELMNKIKSKGEELGSLCDILMGMSNVDAEEGSTDKRWVSIGKTHLQEGIMALVRSVAKPTTF